MFDCANVEMRELLPELAAGTLDAATRARVEQHVASCAECASEVETLRLVRSAFKSAPTVDVQRIVATLPKAVTASRTERSTPPKRWLDWRVAAALTMITVGGLSVAINQRMSPRVTVRDTTVVRRIDTAAPGAVQPIVATPNIPKAADTAKHAPAINPPTRATGKSQLAFTGGVDELDDASLKELLGALDEIERAPVAPPAEPDPTPVLPVIKTGER